MSSKFKIFLLVFVCAVLCFGMISCKDESDGTVSDFTYDGTTITWKCDGDDVSFLVSVNGGEETSVSQPSYTYAADGADFTLSVKVVSDRLFGEEVSDPYTLQFKHIGTVDGLTMSSNETADVWTGNTLSWNKNGSADSYTVVLKTTTGEARYETVNGTSLTVTEAGSYESVAVMPNKTQSDVYYYGTLSEPLSFTVLSAPTNIKYDTKNNSLTWDRVAGAGGYRLSIDGTYYNVTTNTYPNFFPQDSFSVSVQALPKTNVKNTYYSAFSEKEDYTYLDPIDIPTVESGMLIWESVENANGYLLTINGMQSPTVYSECKFQPVAGTSYTVSVKPIMTEGNFFTSWSESLTFTVLEAPQGVKLESGVLTWQSVTNNGGYTVNVTFNGKELAPIVVEEDVTSLDKTVLSFADAGDYKITVTTNSNSASDYASLPSREVNVKRLGAPTNHTIKDDPYTATETLLSFISVPGAKKYSLILEGVEVGVFDNSTAHNIYSVFDANPEDQSFNFEIRSLGDDVESGTNVVLSSIETYSFNIKRLAQPKNVYISDHRIFFDEVEGALDGYIVYLVGSESTGRGIDILKSGETFSANIAPGEYTLSVRAKGNGSDVISSRLSVNDNNKEFKVYKLPKPTVEIRNQQLYVTNIDSKCTSYVIGGTFGNEILVNAGSSYDLTPLVEAGKSVSFEVRALGNGADVLDADTCDALVVTKLNTPTNYALSDTALTWNTVQNASGYKLYSGNTLVATVTGERSNQYSTFELKAGAYSMSVVACGNGSTTFDSDKSSAKSFTKLEAMSVSTPDGDAFIWDAVSNAVRYEIKIGNSPVLSITSDKNSYKPVFDKMGITVCTFRAIGDGVNTVSSNPVELSFTVERLPKPQISVGRVDSGFEVSVTNTADYSAFDMTNRYTFYSNNIIQTPNGTGDKFTLIASNPGKYPIYAVAKGEFFLSGIYYLSSEKSDTQNATILAQVSNVDLTLAQSTEYHGLQFKGVTSAVSYRIVIKVTNGDSVVYTHEYNQSSTIIDFRQHFESGCVLSYEITSIGNASLNIYDSKTVKGSFVIQ